MASVLYIQLIVLFFRVKHQHFTGAHPIGQYILFTFDVSR